MNIKDLRQFRDTDYWCDKNGKLFNIKTQKEIKGHKNKKGYVIVKLGGRNGESINFSRVIAEAWFGDITGKEIHHKNKNKLDNRVKNLEILTPIQHYRKHYGNTIVCQFSKDWELVKVYNTKREVKRLQLIKYLNKKDFVVYDNFYWFHFELPKSFFNFVNENVADRDICDKLLLQLIENELNSVVLGSRVREPEGVQQTTKDTKTALKDYQYI